MEWCELPSKEELLAEKQRLQRRRSFRHSFATTVYFMVIAAAAAVLLSMLVFPVYRVSSHSMAPALSEGDIVVCIKSTDYKSGQVCSFASGNKMLMKRIAGVGGETIRYDSNGNILGEDDVENSEITVVNIPAEKYFMIGDNHSESIDSRSDAVGLVDKSDISGRAILRVWPLERFGIIK